MKTRRATVSSFCLAVAVVMVIDVGCKGDTVTNPPPAATPTPVPANFAGAWSGTAHASTGQSCQNVPAAAVIEQQGQAVSGTLSTETPCGFGRLAFSGSVDGSGFSGAITGNPQAQVGGTLSGTNLQIMVRNLVVASDSMNVAMGLHR